MSKENDLLKDVFKLIAREQKRGHDVFYRMINNDFTFVLKRLAIVGSLTDSNSKVDRMWERLLEIVLFFRTRKHRKPVEILKSFIRVQDEKPKRLDNKERNGLRRAFGFLRRAYSQSGLGETRLASDQTHFYIMITSIIDSNLLDAVPEPELIMKLSSFSDVLERKQPAKKSIREKVAEYEQLSKQKTTDVSGREKRQSAFLEIVRAL